MGDNNSNNSLPQYEYGSDEKTLYYQFSKVLYPNATTWDTTEGNTDFTKLSAIKVSSSYLSSYHSGGQTKRDWVFFISNEIVAEYHIKNYRDWQLDVYEENIFSRSLTADEVSSFNSKIEASSLGLWNQTNGYTCFNSNPKSYILTFVDNNGNSSCYHMIEGEGNVYVGWQDFKSLLAWVSEILSIVVYMNLEGNNYDIRYRRYTRCKRFF